MTIAEDRAYYERRMQQERARAVSEQAECLRALHREWAARYEARLQLLPGLTEHDDARSDIPELAARQGG